jgi:hypothetical protein
MNQVTTDRYRRAVSLCFADGEDLQALMVSASLAWAFIRYSDQYVVAERRAARWMIAYEDTARLFGGLLTAWAAGAAIGALAGNLFRRR